MANQTTGNPIVIDTQGASAIWSGIRKVLLIQWVDDNQDITDGSNLIMTFNSATIEATVQRPTDVGFSPGAVFWQIGPFAKGIAIESPIVSTLGAGHVLFWLE